MLPNKANAVAGSNWEVWLSGRGTTTDETKPCALPLRGDLETDVDGSVAKSATGTTIAATWLNVGGTREKSIKLAGKSLTDMLAGGIPLQIGLEHTLEAEGLEFTAAKIAALEALLDDTAVDAIIKKKNSAKCFYVRNIGIQMDYEMPFDDSKAHSFKITGSKKSDKINMVALVTASFPTSVADIYYGDLDA